MTTVAQIEDSIRALPPDSFWELLDWMNDHSLDMAKSEDGYESPELEAAMLKALDSPRRPMDEAFFEGIRQRYQSKKISMATSGIPQPC